MVSLAMCWPRDWDTPRKPSHRTGTIGMLSSFATRFETASMSSPMSPTGHSDRMPMPRPSGKSPLLKNFKSRIAQIHISGIVEELHKHTYISRTAIRDYMSVSNLIPKEVSIIVESVIDPANIEMEISSAIVSLKQKKSTYTRRKSQRSIDVRVAVH